MGKADYYAEGDWNAVCALCGRKRKASMLERNWQGDYRCPEHNHPRHPQEFVRAIADSQTPPWTQPAPEPIYNLPNQTVEEDGNVTIATTTSYTTVLNIMERVTIPTLTITGAGTIVINNWGIVSAVVNASATVELHNYGVYP